MVGLGIGTGLTCIKGAIGGLVMLRKRLIPNSRNAIPMDVNLLREVSTVVSFAIFIGVVWIALHPGHRKRFEEAARSPLDDEGQARE